MMGVAEPTGPLPTREIRYAGRTVTLADLPEYRKFYAKLTAGTWEPHTFEVFSRYLDEDTVAVDIGSWIGVTPFWAAQVAKAVVAVDPDPKCIRILKGLAAGCTKVSVLEGALSPRSSVDIHAVEGFGSSETSVLSIGGDACVAARGLTLDAIMVHANGAPCFVKIDIEGYEYLIVKEISRLQDHHVRAVQLAVHPQLYERSLSGGRIGRRLRVASATWRLGRAIRLSFSSPKLVKYSGLAIYIAFGILFRGTPRGADFVFERRAGNPRTDRP